MCNSPSALAKIDTVFDLEACARLGRALIWQAVKDAQQPGDVGEQARAWLESEGPGWFDALDCPVDADVWQEWIGGGCPVAVSKKFVVSFL